ncbi:MAG TPA: proline--tRNA ligase [Acidimicrobiales bacterium]|nr:proline--tRNA ligase [Acidimicrobiales bacterium]
MAKADVLTPQADDFPQWYQDVLAKAELAEGGPVRGTMVIRPWGYAIWELMQAEMDARIKATGARNAYFPLFIPESYFRKEAEHVEGFSPELAVVTYGGGKKLEEPVVVRPTSETMIGSYMAKWIQSYRDLPLLLNQWANVVRWELRPRLFLRTTEFLWQEGHTAHASEDDAQRFALKILREVYEDFMVEVLAIPVLTGRKTDRERFAGATTTWAAEAMMRDGKALQMGTSHELGQGFAEAFGITFLDETGQQRHGWLTSWGSSTRMMGGLVMVHGDDSGLRLPPKVAPVQVVVLAVRTEEGAGEAASKIADDLRRAGQRVEIDARTDLSFGRRVVEWELKGVPVRVEIGPRDLAGGTAVLARRDNNTKAPVRLDAIVTEVSRVLGDAHAALLAEARNWRDERTEQALTGGLEEALDATQSGFAVVPGRVISGTGAGAAGAGAAGAGAAGAAGDGELWLNERGVSVRVLQRPDGSLPGASDDLAELVAVVGRAY